MKEIYNIIIRLLNHLPDNKFHDDKTWEWCWCELSDIAQSDVAETRKAANDLLAIIKKELE